MFWLGARWTNRLLHRAKPNPEDPGIEMDSLAIAIQAGLPLRAAAELAKISDTAELQELASGSGIAISDLLVDRADSLRQEQFNVDRFKIQKASVAVLWPLGLTVLPAFVMIAIVPVGTALIQSQ
jgi:tight adherence protein B